MCRERSVMWIGLALLGLSALLIGCRAPGELPRDEARAFAEAVAPTTERLFQALNAGDEALFVAEMTPQMSEASSGEGFIRMREQIWGRIGDFESAEMRKVLHQNEFWNVLYRADFADEKGVTVRVVYADVEGVYLVAGLWLDSAKLRAAQ